MYKWKHGKKKKGKCLQSTVLYTSLKPGKNHVKPNSTLNKLSPKTCDIPQRCTAQNNTKDDAQHLSCLHPCVPSIRLWIGDLCQPLLSNRHQSSLWFCQVCCYV